MEIKITFFNPHKDTRIPIDYQYYLSSWVYNIIQSSDAHYAQFLHDTGYKVSASSNKIFKLFCFSNLLIPTYSIDKYKQTINIQSEEFYLKMRFKVDLALEHFIKGLFINQQLKIKTGYDKIHTFDIKTVETKGIQHVSDEARIRTLSPIFLSKIVDNNLKFLSPEDEMYEITFFQNLLDKFIAAGGTIPHGWENATQKISLPPYVKVRSKKNEIKKGSDRPIEVRSYSFDFDIVAPAPLIEIGLLAGFGRDNAMGFGYGEVIE